MTSIKSLLSAFLIGICCCQEAAAIKAYPHPVSVRQPDGSTLIVRIHGDENYHYATSVDGYMLAKDHEGFFCYIDYDFSTGKRTVTDLRAHNMKERDDKEKSFVANLKAATVINADIRSRMTFVSKAPATTLAPRIISPRKLAPQKTETIKESQYLVILVNFQDSVFRYTKEDFSDWLNEPGYSTNGGTGSVKDYYRDNSMGQFVPNFQVVGPYTLSQPLAYYGGNSSSSGDDENPRDMVKEACELAKAANPSLDFSQFDNDGDGQMDNCYIIYAGYSEASTANDDDIWPHSWYMGEEAFQIDGITIENYSCSAELVGMPGAPVNPMMDGIGTFTHEFGHILGLKDLYDTDDYTNGYGVDPGTFSLYASGSYNNESRTPPYLWAFERMQLGWCIEGTDLIEMKDAEDVTLDNISENKARFINAQPGREAGTGHEWFVFENRQQSGWDRYIPAHGLLIYHYDYTQDMQEKYWSVNGPNNNAKHRCLYLKAADGIDDVNSRAGDTYPGTSANTSFTDSTTPNSLNWNGEPVNVPVTNIMERDGKVLFQVNGGTSTWDFIRTNVPDEIRDTTATFTAEITSRTQEISETGFCWSADEAPTIDNDDHIAADDVTNPTCTVDNLKPGSNYNVRAYMKMADGSVVYGSAVPFTTECMASGAPFLADFTSWTNGTPDCWSIVDRNGDGTTWIYDESAEAMLYQFDYWNDADDWLICKRRFHVPANGAIYIMRGITEASTIENLEVYISTKSSGIDDFYKIDQFSFADNFGSIYLEETDISQYAGQDIYVALRCSSEKLQNSLWLWGIMVMDKLGTPEITRFDKSGDDQLTVEWTPVDNAIYYYLLFGKETDEPNSKVLFAPVSFFENVKGDVDVAVGSASFKSDGSFELKTIPEGVLDCKFIVTTSGPFGTSELTVEGTKDGVNWTVIGPRITLSEYDDEGQECDWESYVAGKNYIKLRFTFKHDGRNGRIKYLTLEYNDGKVIEELASGTVNGTSTVIYAKTAGEFDTGRFVAIVNAGDGILFYDDSAPKYYTNSDNTAIEDIIAGTDIRLSVSRSLLRISGLEPGATVRCSTLSGVNLFSGTAESTSLDIRTDYSGIVVISIESNGQSYNTKAILR